MTQSIEPWSLTEKIAQAQETRALQEAGRIIEIKQKLEPWYDRVVSYVVHKLGEELSIPATVERYRYITTVHGYTELERCESELSSAQAEYGSVNVVLRALAQDVELLVWGCYDKRDHNVVFDLAVPVRCGECGLTWAAGDRIPKYKAPDLEMFEHVTAFDDSPYPNWWRLPRDHDELILGLGDRLRAIHYRLDRVDRTWVTCTEYRELYPPITSRLSSVPQPLSSTSESPIEERFWQVCQRSTSPELAGLVQQYEVGSYRLDLALPGLRVGVELDGYAWHSDRHTFVRDRSRQRALELAGWRIIRFAGSEINQGPENCVRQLIAFVQMIEAQT